MKQAADLGSTKQFEPALALLAASLESCRQAGDAVGEALVQAGRAELLERAQRKPEAAEAWEAGARAWGRAGHSPGSVECWWRAALGWPINTARSQAAVTRAADAAAADRRRPLASAAACAKGARALEAARRRLSARQLYEAALEIYARVAPDAPEYARTLVDLSDLLRERSDYEPAAAHLRRALAIVEPRGTERFLLEILNKLSVICSRQGRLADAEQLCGREVALRRKLDPDSAALAGSLLNYALVFARRGDDEQAERILEEALPLQEKRAPRSPGHAATLETLGLLALRRSQLKSAERLHLQAYEIRKARDPESDAVSTSLANLAVIRIQRGDWATADRYLTWALQIRQKRQSDSVEVAQIHMSQAHLAGARGDVPAARKFTQQALQIFERRSPNSPNHAIALLELGHLSHRDGNLSAAWRQLADGVTMLEKEAIRTPQLANGLVRLATLEIERGDFGVARTHLTRALAIFERHNPRSLNTIKTLTQLGRVAALEDQHSEAREYLDRAQKALQQTRQQGEMHAQVLIGMAELSLAAGRPAEATPLIAEAVALLEKERESSPALAVATHLQAECWVAQGRKVEAEAAYRKSLSLWKQRAPRLPGRAQSLYRLALLLRASPDRRPEAVNLAVEAWDILQQQGEGIAGDESLQAFVRLRAPVAAGVASLLAEAGQVEKSLQILEDNRAQGLRHLLDEQRIRPPGVSDEAWQNLTGAAHVKEQAEESVIARANALTQARQDLSRANSGAVSARATGDLRNRIEELEESLKEAERGLVEARDRVQRLWSQVRKVSVGDRHRSAFPLSMAHARQAARGGTALLYYSVGEDRTLLYFIPPATATGTAPTMQVHSLPVALTALAAEVGALVGDLREARAEAVPRSRRLADRLFPPGVRESLGRARRVVVIPDGPLWELPMGALVLPSPPRIPSAKGNPAVPRVPAELPRFLGLEVPVSVESSLALFAERERSAPSSRASLKVLAMGDPLLPGSHPPTAPPPGAPPPTRSMLPGPVRELGPIPGTRADAQSVAGLYGVQALLAESASEPAVRAALPDADVVHFATHGYLHPFWSRASGLVLSRDVPSTADPRPETDGLLQSWEIYGGPRLRADLVVLAACETGAGAITRGEGVNSLSRAFRAAGARSVVASLWKVRDDSTQRLMLAFHRRIRQGTPKDEALHLAMQEVAARPGMRHPYHWGAFLLVGDRTNHLAAPAAAPVRKPTASPPRSIPRPAPVSGKNP